MKILTNAILALALILTVTGCANNGNFKEAMAVPSMAMSEESESAADVQPERMLIWTASMSLQVWNISNAVHEVTVLAEKQGGFIENKSDHGDTSANLTVRVPAKSFKAALSSLETLGTVTYRRVESEDVTEQYIDVEARLKNKIVLRDRLKQLLDKATAVKDVLAIETELNRVQSDIDSMEGRMRSMKKQVTYATVTLSLERKPILGPLGYVFKGLWWGVEKLFVIRE
jgi:Domain of unknown function (DUF4349)